MGWVLPCIPRFPKECSLGRCNISSITSRSHWFTLHSITMEFLRTPDLLPKPRIMLTIWRQTKDGDKSRKSENWPNWQNQVRATLRTVSTARNLTHWRYILLRTIVYCYRSRFGLACQKLQYQYGYLGSFFSPASCRQLEGLGSDAEVNARNFGEDWGHFGQQATALREFRSGGIFYVDSSLSI